MRFNKAMREKSIPAKACGKCFVVKGHGAFHTQRSKPDGRVTKCRECQARDASLWYSEHRDRSAENGRRWHAGNRQQRNEAARRWHADNQESHNAASRRWNRENPGKRRLSKHKRRALKAAATIETFTASDMYADWEDHGLWNCFYCAGPLDTLNIEHFEALDNGGPHALHNLVPSCRDCNLSKGTKEEWGFLADRLAERGIDLDACLAIFDDEG
ncbi:HNH endonuclease [Streptomyces sp. NPDC090231]|uniref:HNH endonuclease n=1 Tax=unclassified Streptomyces TaxID=2593676 RepID=UPI00382022C9